MVLASPINWTSIQKALHAWFIGATGLETVWANQLVPKNYPYAVLNIIDLIRVGGQDELRYTTDLAKPPGEEVGIEVLGLRQMTVRCEVLVEPLDAADATKNARHYLSIAQSSLSLPSNLTDLRKVGLAVVSENGVEVVDEVINNKPISKGRINVRFALTSHLEERTGFIQQVEISSTGLGKTNLTKEPYGDVS